MSRLHRDGTCPSSYDIGFSGQQAAGPARNSRRPAVVIAVTVADGGAPRPVANVVLTPRMFVARSGGNERQSVPETPGGLLPQWCRSGDTRAAALCAGAD